MAEQDIEKQLLIQYDKLSTEIQEIDKQNLQIFGFVVGAVATIVVAAFSKVVTAGDPAIRMWLLVVALSIVWIGTVLIIGNRIRVWRISTYIQVFIERKLLGMKWETYITLAHAKDRHVRDESGKILPKPPEPNALMRELLTFGVIVSVIFLAGCQAALQMNVWSLQADETLGTLALACMTAAFIGHTYKQVRKLARSRDVEDEYFDYWKAIQRTEKIRRRKKRYGIKKAVDGSPSTPASVRHDAVVKESLAPSDHNEENNQPAEPHPEL